MNPTYDDVKIFGTTAVTAGVLSDGTGPVTSVGEGALAAAQAMGVLRSRLERHLKAHYGGGLEKVQQVVRLEGYVFAGPDFGDHSRVLDGASEVLFRTFGNERGRHTRVAVGASSLPNGGSGRGRAVELSLWVELDGNPVP